MVEIYFFLLEWNLRNSPSWTFLRSTVIPTSTLMVSKRLKAATGGKEWANGAVENLWGFAEQLDSITPTHLKPHHFEPQNGWFKGGWYSVGVICSFHILFFGGKLYSKDLHWQKIPPVGLFGGGLKSYVEARFLGGLDMDVEPKIGGFWFYPQNGWVKIINGKAYEQMDDLVGFPIIVGNTHMEEHSINIFYHPWN